MNLIRTFCNLINQIPPTDEKKAIQYLGLWNKSFWPVRISNFLYQLFSNSLPVAARLGNRYKNDPLQTIDERCGWCSRDGYNVPERETFNHIYFDCPTTSKLLAQFSDKYLDPNFSQAERVKAIFFGQTNLGDRDDILQITGIIFAYCIWAGKLRKKAISFFTIEENMFFLFDGIANSNSWVKKIVETKDDNWSRLWRGRTGGGRG